MATTISNARTGPFVLASADNPLSITLTGSVTSTGSADAIDGASTTSWSITNAGQVTAVSGLGISLAGAGTVDNSGTISGLTGVSLAGGGSVTNGASGTISGSGAIGAGPSVGAGVSIRGKAGTVDNSGSISGAAYGIAMTNGGTVTNASSIVGGEDGVIILGATGTVSNTSSITATVDDGVALFAGGTVTNGASATISSGSKVGSAGVFITAGAGTLNNSGTITSAHIGALLNLGGAVTNNASASITGSEEGVYTNGALGKVDNAGTITATGTTGCAVYIAADGTLTNAAAGVITGNQYGAFIEGGTGDARVDNYGKITGQTLDGVILGLGGTVANYAGATITGGTSGIYVKYRAAGTVTNSGTVSGTGSAGTGVDLADGGSITNNAGGSITGTQFGVFTTKASATVNNSGTITGSQYDGVALVAGGTVINASGGTIQGGSGGVYIEVGGSGTVTNSGSIQATATGGTGLILGGGGSVSNTSTGQISGAACGLFSNHAAVTVTNDGTLSGGSGASLAAGGSLTNSKTGSISGVSSGFFSNGAPATLTNSGSVTASGTTGAGADMEGGGTVTNMAGGVISGTTFGIFMTGGASTITNAGTISGNNYAIDFASSAANRLIVDPGAVFNGGVNGGGGTLELASGTGSLSGIGGTAFYNFAKLSIDAGANWTLTGSNTAANILNDGTATVSGSLVASAIDPSGTGTFVLAGSSTLEIGSDAGLQAQMLFQTGSTLVIDTASASVGTTTPAGPLLTNFGVGDTIDLKTFSSVGAAFTFDSSTGLLQLTNTSAQAASLDFQANTMGSGIFKTASDGGTGLSIHWVTVPKVTITTAGLLTRTPSQVIAGTVDVADAGTTVSLYDNGATAPLATALVGQDGSWSAKVTLVGDGPHSLIAKDTDTAGNTGTSNTIIDTLDTTAPLVAITTAGLLTRTPAQVIAGTVDVADAGTTVSLYDNGATTPLATALVGQDGSWSAQVTLVGDGAHSLIAKDTDAAGNTGTSNTIIDTLDTTAPLVAITTVGLLTNTPAQVIAGTVDVADAGTTVSLYDNGATAPLATALVGQDGSWSAQVTLVGDGAHSLIAKDTDAAGNTGTSNAIADTLDTTAPLVAITTAGLLTRTPSQVIAGTVDVADAGTTVSLYDNGATAPLATALVGQDGSWSAQVTLVGDGAHSLIAKDTDAAGNTGTSNAIIDTLDTTAPLVAITTAAILTQTPAQVIAGTVDVADAGTIVSLYDNGATAPLATALVGQDGSWSAQVTLVGDGAHSLIAKDTDAAGNTGTSNAIVDTLDTTAPLVAITTAGLLTRTPSQVIAGTVDVADAGTTVSLYDNGATAPLATALVGQDGSWSAQVTLVGDGAHSLIAKDTDAAGNTGTSNAIADTLDTTAPLVSASADLAMVVASVEAGATEGFSATATDSIDGTDPVVFTELLADGTSKIVHSGDVFSLGRHTIVASATDAAGNTGTAAPFSFTVGVTNVSLDGSFGVQQVIGAGSLNYVDASAIPGSGEVVVDLLDGVMLKGGQLVATLQNIQGVQLGADPSIVLGLASGTDLIYGGSGPDQFYNSGGTDYILGSTTSNAIVGGTGTTAFFGTGGADTMFGGSGLNFMQAGPTASSADVFYGNGGTDYVQGGPGATDMIGGSGTEVLSGGSGFNQLVGSNQSASALNVLVGGTGTDVFYAGIGTNLFYEGSGVDVLAGNAGTDYVYGGSGQSYIYGGSGTDVITTGAGNQYVHAGSGHTYFSDTSANLTAGRVDWIDNFAGGQGTDLYLPTAVQGETSFVQQNGGTAVLTAVGGGTAEVFAGGADLATVQAHTHFTLS